MLTTFIKYLYIYFFCIIFYNLAMNRAKLSVARIFTQSSILTISTYVLSINLNDLKYIIPLLALWFIESLFHKQPQNSFVALTIAFAISYSIHSVSSFVIAALFLSFFQNETLLPLFAILSGSLQSVLTIQLLKVKRFKNKIPLLSTSSFSALVTIPCLLLCGISIYFTLDYTAFKTKLYGFLSFTFTLAFLIYWWQTQITKSYRRSLELRELESMRVEMAELKLQMKKVLVDNDRLSRMSHRDNTLLTSLKNATTQMLTKLDPVSAEAIEAGKLLRSIEALGIDRAPAANEAEANEAKIFDTGFSLLDDVLNEMEVKSIRDNITFSVHFGTNLAQFIPDIVAEIDVMHTVDDLLKNAFKSTLTQETRAVQLQFYKLGKHFVIEVADSGIPFEVESLVNMGLEKRTTYEDGSGIGLIEIWDIKENYSATYHLEEYKNTDPFTKRISLTFDKKNRYSIRTYRKTEILPMSRRADLQVYDFSEN